MDHKVSSELWSLVQFLKWGAMPTQLCLAHLLCISTCKLIIAGNINLVVINHTGRSKEIALKWVILTTLSDCFRCNLLGSWCVQSRLLAGTLAQKKICKLLCTIHRIMGSPTSHICRFLMSPPLMHDFCAHNCTGSQPFSSQIANEGKGPLVPLCHVINNKGVHFQASQGEYHPGEMLLQSKIKYRGEDYWI